MSPDKDTKSTGRKRPGFKMPRFSKPDLSKVSHEDRVKFIVLLVALAVMVVIGIMLVPYFKNLITSDNREQVAADIRSKGPLGVLMVVGLEVLQILIAVIPGEVVQMIAGIVYGTVGGWFWLAIGAIIGSVLIYKIVEKLGMPFVRSVVSEEMFEKLDFLNDNKRIDFIVFILYFIPGLPKDVFTYFIPLTEMPLSRFLMVSTIARTPALLASTYAGASFTSGNYVGMIVMFVICGGLGIIGIINRDRIFDWFRDKKERVIRALTGGGRPGGDPARALPGRDGEGRRAPTSRTDHREASGDLNSRPEGSASRTEVPGDGASPTDAAPETGEGPVRAHYQERTRSEARRNGRPPAYTGGPARFQKVFTAVKEGLSNLGRAIASGARWLWLRFTEFLASHGIGSSRPSRSKRTTPPAKKKRRPADDPTPGAAHRAQRQGQQAPQGSRRRSPSGARPTDSGGSRQGAGQRRRPSGEGNSPRRTGSRPVDDARHPGSQRTTDGRGAASGTRSRTRPPREGGGSRPPRNPSDREGHRR